MTAKSALDVEGVDGVRLRATRVEGEGPTVLLLHGLVSQRRTWEPVISRLAGLDMLAIDLRGHGESDAPTTGYDPQTCAADVAHVMETLDGRTRRAVVVGHSWGAAVAAELAASRPDLTAALVLIDAGYLSVAEMGARDHVRSVMAPAPMELPLTEVEALFQSGPLARYWTPEVREVVLACFRAGDDGLWRRRLGSEHHMQIIDGMLDQDVVATLKAIQAPTWIAICESMPGRSTGSRFDDPHWAAVREAAIRRAAEVLSQPRILRWGGAIHDVHLQWPGLVAGLIQCAHDDAVRASTEGEL